MVKKAVMVGLLLVVVLASVVLGSEIIVTSTADSGTGTLRWALQTARSGDTITFDPKVFPPRNSATIHLRSCLPAIRQGRITVDASDAGVILDGQALPSEEAWGVEISSNGNAIHGLQVINIPGPGIVLVEKASGNTIGGDRTAGSGPIGHGNLSSGNNGGICMWGEGPSHNTIIGNLIGTDVTGTEPFGNIDGIFLSGGASHNTIGPDNIIAYNREHAVVVQDPNSVGNTINQNSVHSNGWGGVLLLEGTSGNTITRNAIYENRWAGIRFEEAEPGNTVAVLDDASLQLGRVAGIACPGCIVELFSDANAEGRTFESRAVADASGRFLVASGSALSGPVITATVTDPNGTTGPFFVLAYVPTDSAELQGRNPHLVTPIAVRTSDQLEDNRLAQLASLFNPASEIHSKEQTEELLRQHVDLGLKWLRLSLDWLDWCEVVKNPEFSSTYVDPVADMAITMLNGHDVNVMLCLVYWDDGISTVDPPVRMYTTGEEIDRYAHYVRSIVRHFRGKIPSYALLNEPNVPEPGQFVTPDDYVELVRCTVPVIREEDPNARIVIGEITPLWDCNGLNYLFNLLDSDVLPMIDGIAWHWGGASPELHAGFYYGYPALVREIRSIAEKREFKGELLAEEITLRTAKTPHPSEYMGYEEISSLKYTLRIALMNLGLDLAAGLNFQSLDEIPLLELMAKNLCAVMAGHEAIDMPVEINIETDSPVSYCAFRYLNGDRMLAVWTDGIAQDEDPGVPATITFPGLTAETVTGIDVLHGFEQELNFEIDAGNTVIRALVVKDYPTLVKLSDVKMSSGYVENVGDGFHRIGEPGASTAPDRDGDGVPDAEDYCPDWPGSKEANGC